MDSNSSEESDRKGVTGENVDGSPTLIAACPGRDVPVSRHFVVPDQPFFEGDSKHGEFLEMSNSRVPDDIGFGAFPNAENQEPISAPAIDRPEEGDARMNIHHRLSNWLIKKTIVFAVFLHRQTLAAEQALIAHYRRENMVR